MEGCGCACIYASMHAYARPVLWMRFEDACNDDVKGGIDDDLDTCMLAEDMEVSGMEETTTANGRVAETGTRRW
jgi:hypothetical protein